MIVSKLSKLLCILGASVPTAIINMLLIIAVLVLQLIYMMAKW